MADIATPVHVMLCIDVLEHIAQASAFFLQMDRLLSRGGVLVLRVPWASMAPHPEHLPEAEADWIGEGQGVLERNYQLIRPFSFGGIYHKM